MGDRKATLAKARQELEDLYLGVPDESVNLTFQHLAELNQQNGLEGERNKKPTMEAIQEVNVNSGLGKSPSLDFTKGIQASKARQQQYNVEEGRVLQTTSGHRHVDQRDSNAYNYKRDQYYNNYGTPNNNPRRNMGFESSFAYDDQSGMSISAFTSPYEGGGRRRPGIPHSNICTICSTYIYIFRHRCLVCGRVYCRHCVSVGMGEMTEGRKCVECLGSRFSQRYIQRAGQTGCCTRYPRMVKQQELLWAEKGPRRSREGRAYGRTSEMISPRRSPTSPMGPRPRSPPSMQGSGTPSFAMLSMASPVSPSLPFVV